MAKCYELGTGTDINLEEAFNNYQISALHGFDGAYLDLARCFENGIGTNVNLQEAKKFKDLASKKSKFNQSSEENKEQFAEDYQKTPHEAVRRAAYIFDPIQAGIEPVKSLSDTFSTHPGILKRLAAIGFIKPKNDKS